MRAYTSILIHSAGSALYFHHELYTYQNSNKCINIKTRDQIEIRNYTGAACMMV